MITEIILDPDHDALGSFVPNNIPNGTRTVVSSFSRIKCRWQDGKVVDSNGRVIVDCSKRTSKEEEGDAKD